MIQLTIFLEKINANLLKFNQSGKRDFIDGNLQNLFSYSLFKTINNNYCLVLQNTNGDVASFSTGSLGWDINGNEKVSYALSLDGAKIVFSIPDYLLQGFI